MSDGAPGAIAKFAEARGLRFTKGAELPTRASRTELSAQAAA
jgi:hypothetical protein